MSKRFPTTAHVTAMPLQRHPRADTTAHGKEAEFRSPGNNSRARTANDGSCQRCQDASQNPTGDPPGNSPSGAKPNQNGRQPSDSPAAAKPNSSSETDRQSSGRQPKPSDDTRDDDRSTETPSANGSRRRAERFSIESRPPRQSAWPIAIEIGTTHHVPTSSTIRGPSGRSPIRATQWQQIHPTARPSEKRGHRRQSNQWRPQRPTSATSGRVR